MVGPKRSDALFVAVLSTSFLSGDHIDRFPSYLLIKEREREREIEVP